MVIRFSGEIETGKSVLPANNNTTILVGGRDIISSLLTNKFGGEVFVTTDFGLSSCGYWMTAYGCPSRKGEAERRPVISVGDTMIGDELLSRDGENVTILIADHEEEINSPISDDHQVKLAADYIRRSEWAGRYMPVRQDRCEKLIRHWTTGDVHQCSHKRAYRIAGHEFCRPHAKAIKTTLSHMGIIGVDDVDGWEVIEGMAEPI